MTRWLLAAVLVAGCWRSRAAPPAITNHASDPGYVITALGVGPFDASTEATQAALQRRAPELRVVARDLGGESGIVFDILDGTERLFYVVPDDAPGYVSEDGKEHRYSSTTFAVFAVSEKVRVEGRSWRAGQSFSEVGNLDVCECWGNRDVTACYRRGSRIRLIFEESCNEAENAGPRAMLGKAIGRIMWKRLIEPYEPIPSE